MVLRKNLLVISVAVLAATLVAVPAVDATRGDKKDHKVGICHATGSQSNPYVFIRVSKNAADAHKRHHDGRDVIDAKSKDDCPKKAVLSSTQTVDPEKDESKTKTQKESKKTEELAVPTELPKAGPGALIAGITAMGTLGYATTAYLRSRKLV